MSDEELRDEVEVLRSLLRRLVDSRHRLSMADELSERAQERLRSGGNVATLSGGYCDINAEQVESLKRALEVERR